MELIKNDDTYISSIIYKKKYRYQLTNFIQFKHIGKQESNGLKIRSAGGNINMSGATYIGMAFAEAPLVGTNNVPCTAR